MPDKSPLSLNELARRIENIVRAGTVAEVDLPGVRCRVQSGQLRTTWLPFFMRRAGNVRQWSPVSIGEQCVILSPGGDLAAGMVIVGLYSDTIAPASTSPDIERTDYPDGASIVYDHVAHALTVTLPDGGTADITAPTSVTVHSSAITLDAPETTLNGNLTVHGHVHADDDVVAGTISLQGHVHSGVISGASNTGEPQ